MSESVEMSLRACCKGLSYMFTMPPQRYPIVWQGHIIVKSQEAAVQIHYIAGDKNLASERLPIKGTSDADASRGLLAALKIKDRLRINAQHLDNLNSRMMDEQGYCMLVALPCGRNSDDLNKQTTALKSKFIDYLAEKHVAGIINLDSPAPEGASQQQQYVLHFFPPCDFSNENILLRAPDLYMNVSDIHHLMLLIMPA